MPPGEGLLPGARDVDVVEPISAWIGGLPSRSRLLIRLALLAVEWSSFPRRLSALELQQRGERLSRLESHPLLADAMLLCKTLVSFGYGRDAGVQAALGVSLACHSSAEGVRREAAPTPPQSVTPPSKGAVDVLVVGSGAGGAAAARVLAEAGASVLVVEAGGWHTAPYSKDPLEALRTLYRDGGLIFAEGRPAIPLPVGRCVGGTTVVNSGTMLRPDPAVLRDWRERFGIPWAEDLDFDSVERDLGVEPVDPASAGRNAELCRLGAEAIGARNGPLPRNAPGVSCCGTCPTGCAIDAKRAAHVAELPAAIAAGALVEASAPVERVLTDCGRASGVRLAGGRSIAAGKVLLAGGALGTPELMLRSGLGNGAVGRNLHVHPACWVGALYDEEVRGWEGVMQSWHVDEWRDRGLFLEATFTPLPFGAHWLPGAGAAYRERLENYPRLGVIGVHLSEHASRGRVRVKGGRLRVGYRLDAEDAAAIRFGIARAAQIHFAAGAREVYPCVRGIPSIAAGEETKRIEKADIAPARLRLEAFHPMGTARLAADPAQGAVAPIGEAHGVPDLWVADASVLPTSLGANPMVTIMACARQIAANLAEAA